MIQILEQLLESKPLKKLTTGLVLYYSIMVLMLVYLIFDYIIEKAAPVSDLESQ